jgi:hypothetical protein
MISNLNFYPANEENYTMEQPNDSSFLAEIFPTYDQTNSYQTYDQTNSYPTSDQTNSYPTYDQTNFYPTYDQINSYSTYDQTNSYLYPAVYSNNIIFLANPAVPPHKFFCR